MVDKYLIFKCQYVEDAMEEEKCQEIQGGVKFPDLSCLALPVASSGVDRDDKCADRNVSLQ